MTTLILGPNQASKRVPGSWKQAVMTSGHSRLLPAIPLGMVGSNRTQFEVRPQLNLRSTSPTQTNIFTQKQKRINYVIPSKRKTTQCAPWVEILTGRLASITHKWMLQISPRNSAIIPHKPFTSPPRGARPERFFCLVCGLSVQGAIIGEISMSGTRA